MYVCLFVGLHVRVYVSGQICRDLLVCARLHVCMHVFMYECMFLFVFVYLCVFEDGVAAGASILRANDMLALTHCSSHRRSRLGRWVWVGWVCGQAGRQAAGGLGEVGEAGRLESPRVWKLQLPRQRQAGLGRTPF